MSSFFAPAEVCVQACTAKASTSTMATSGGDHLGARCRLNGGAGEGTAKRLDLPPCRPGPARSDHRVAGEHARTGERGACEALEKLPAKDIDRDQSAPQKALMRIFLPAKAPTSILTTRSMAASALCELTRVLHVACLEAEVRYGF